VRVRVPDCALLDILQLDKNYDSFNSLALEFSSVVAEI
jgi:hypothetical protein